MTIERSALQHRSKSEYAYAVDDETVQLRLRTKRGDVDRVSLLWGDKYDWPDSARRSRLERVRRDARFDYWTTAVVPPHRRLCYGFLVADGDEQLWYTERGIDRAAKSAETEFPPEGRRDPGAYFEFPFVHPIDRFDPPDWVADAVFYQIFPERFANGDPTLDPDGVEPWGGRPDRDSFYGGDLQGIIDRLPYIDDLGVTALYLTPVFESPSNHKYNTTDYKRIDPHFGDEETLRELVAAAHDREIRVVLDAVFNHCGYGFPPFQDVLEKGPDSEYADWFHVHEFPIETDPRPNYDAFAFEAYMPKFDTSNPEVREYLVDVATYWVEQVGIDGWRLDVANEVDHEFWRMFRRELKAIDPELFILGEIWHDPRPWLRGNQFDSAMNYPYREAIYDYLARDRLDGERFADRVDSLLMRHPGPVNRVLFDLLGSHDTPRALRACDDDERRLRLAVLLLLTAPGVPCVYYGDEVGMTGGDDPDCRRPMRWDEAEQNRELRSFYRSAIDLRHEYEALRRGRLVFDRAGSGGDVVVYRRETTAEVVGVAINRGTETQTVSSPAIDISGDLLLSTIGPEREVSVELLTDGLRLPPLSGGVVRSVRQASE